jgi:hypothetical protein
MSRGRGSGRGRVGHREGKRDLARRNLGAEPVFLVNNSGRKPWARHLKGDTVHRRLPTLRMRSEDWSMERRSAAYHRAAAARARRLRAEATTPWLKEHLENAIAQHEQIAAEIERASELDGDAVSSQDETSALSSETPG